MRRLLNRTHEFVTHDLWQEFPTASRLTAMGLHTARVAILAARNFISDHCLMRATALAYVTLLSLVPLLAFALSVARGFGAGEVLIRWIKEVVAGGKGLEDAANQITKAVANVNASAVGAVGLLVLVWATIKLLSTIEKSFNEIWGIKRGRTWFRKFTDYVSVTVTAPLLILVGMSVRTTVEAEFFDGAVGRVLGGPLISVATLGVTWLAFACIYIFMPNTRVRPLSALAGGVLGGTAFQIMFWLYTSVQIGLGRQNPIYGTLAALPVFMTWLYMSWTIVLFGAEVACAADNVNRYWEDRRARGVSGASREAIALRCMTVMATAFQRDEMPLTADDIAGQLHISSRIVQDTVDTLTNHKLCSSVSDDDRRCYQPARPLEHITPADIVAAIRNEGQTVTMGGDGAEAALVEELLGRASDLGRAGLSDMTLHDMVVRLVDAQPDQTSA
jgi:membrane protein